MSDEQEKQETFAEEVTGKFATQLGATPSDVSEVKRKARDVQWKMLLVALWLADRVVLWLWLKAQAVVPYIGH